MVCEVIKTWGWSSFATEDKPEWKDLVARLGELEPQPQPQQEGEKKEKPRRRTRRKNKKEKVYEFYSEVKLLDMPGELLDLILGEESLNLRDHLALAATCRSLRACYYTPSSSSNSDPNASSNSRHSLLWSSLLKLRPMPRQARRYLDYDPSMEEEVFAVEHIWTNAEIDPSDENQVKEMQVVRVLPKDWELTKAGKARKNKRKRGEEDDKEGDLGIKSKEWNEALENVNYYRMTKMQAQSVYKLKSDELETYLYAFCKPNPYGKHNAPHMQCFLEASVESLAFRLHGGPFGHDQLIEKREAATAKAKATREKNGTTYEAVAKRQRTGSSGSSGSSGGGGRSYNHYGWR
ncbi:uncharacterized protein JCM6883_005379 [Sporobolomyces salmoneus]|uniref:uncharacterized protein n=1 Tax=Sporobolomyces salmoneus TaxID=183962 RepID=UPI0031785182